MLIRTIRNLSAFFISLYLVNKLLATPTLQKEFSVTEKCLIKAFDINFCLNWSKCVHNTSVNNLLIESLLLGMTKSSVKTQSGQLTRHTVRVLWPVADFQSIVEM
jgi:hypothetical protein